MAIDGARARKYLKDFDFKNLFIDELGWDHHQQTLDIQADGATYTLTAVAQKRGFVAFICAPDSQGHIPPYATRRKIERQAAKSVREHLMIFLDAAPTTQTWQWVKRELGKPDLCREHTFHRHQDGESLVQKLRPLEIALEEEEKLFAASEVDARVATGFYAERVTKKFYDRFKTEHDVFLRFIQGIPDAELQRWYASVMLNRLMFIYFIQKKGFLGGDQNYLRNKLTESRFRGRDRFYQEFICPLFFEGFAKKAEERSPAINQLLGEVPYLNGGIFLKHEIEIRQEQEGRETRIPDSAFEKIFAFFDDYNWHLDERPVRADYEINPDVLGYIFEKYINQKQMGAYYTKEDITEYISKSTIIPFLFDAAEKKCAIAFKEDSALWRMLRDDPDRYIYDAVRQGVDQELPEEIAAGINDVGKRGDWNKPAVAEFALPTETWREHVARRQRCHEVRAKLAAGEIHSINDLITYNLDLRRFAQDVIENCEGPELLRAFYHAIEKMTVLDPTCGSGAFLFAALNILEPLYDACLDRMAVFVEELERSEVKHHPQQFSDFKQMLARIEEHPNHRYFVLKSIIIKNLYGVDLMHEAVEICKLRLFLKLVAQVDNVEKIEPLPDIDFNIRAGNTLVGFANLEEVRYALVDVRTRQGRFPFGEEQDALDRITVKAADVQQLADMFRKKQLENEGAVPSADKGRLQQELAELGEELDRFLAALYGINRKDKDYAKRFNQWRASHQPFHWFSEFYGIIKSGGFDVIIGNPPYVEYKDVRDQYTIQGYKTEPCGDLYAFIMERSNNLLGKYSKLGMIVPVSSLSTDGFNDLRDYILNGHRLCWTLSFAERPSKLFNGVDKRLSIWVISQGNNTESIFLSNYRLWFAEERDYLFCKIVYALKKNGCFIVNTSIPKVSSEVELNILNRLTNSDRLDKFFLKRSDYHTYYSRKLRYFLQVLDFEPQVLDGNGNLRPPSEFKKICFKDISQAKIALCALNSNLFYWFVIVFSDCRHVNKREVDTFPLGLDKIAKNINCNELIKLADNLMLDLKEHSEVRRMRFRHDNLTVQCIIPKQSKLIIDKIDQVLALHYGFTDEEMDFIINYDIKYRMGVEADDGE